ncbi:MAG: 1-acyl-sn-glycerol-3-phosphate acyltransferase, partial [Acidimicrobiia bacterium]
VLPLRVAWLPPERDGKRTVRWVDVLKLGDPRDPGPLRERIILARHPDRVRIVAGEGAPASELLEAHARSVETLSVGELVTRRAWLALERAERRERGNRYKVPRLVAEDILRRPDFREAVAGLAAETRLSEEAAIRRAGRYLREIAAGHSPFLIDLIANAIHWLYRQGYGAILYDPAKVREIAAISQQHPVVFLPTHRSQMDRLSMQFLLWENDLPPNHTAGGINMNFVPGGALMRRTGVFFIRRSFKDNPLYKLVLRSYIDYLIEKRFPLEWYIEGARSRTGKLLPPRYGLLSYVVDSVRRGKSEDLYLLPVSIAYDQIQDVAAYAREQQGGEKQPESAAWALSAIRQLRKPYGNIHVRFAEPISVTKELGSELARRRTQGPAQGTDVDEPGIDLQKLAFEVLYRISRVTPLTPTSLVTTALLQVGGRARTVEELAEACGELGGLVVRRGWPTTEPLRLEEPDEVGRTLDLLAAHGNVSSFTKGPRPVFWLDDQQKLRASYYRNMVVHYFVPGAIAELALLGASQGFWDEVGRLRDLLKFEFFFAEREQFHEEVRRELAEAGPGWEERLEAGQVEGRALLAHLRPLRAHWALLPFLEAYQMVGDALEGLGPGEVVEEKPFLARCLSLGKQYRLQGTITAEESISATLCKAALDLAGNRGLTGPEGSNAAARRAAFAADIREMRRRADQIGTLAISRRGSPA